jgi:hypothetical protein
MEIIASLVKDAPMWLQAIMGVLSALTAVTSITPSRLDDQYLGKATKIVNFGLKLMNVGAGNIGRNQNKDSGGTTNTKIKDVTDAIKSKIQDMK